MSDSKPDVTGETVLPYAFLLGTHQALFKL